jgi:hypothetical protein
MIYSDLKIILLYSKYKKKQLKSIEGQKFNKI